MVDCQSRWSVYDSVEPPEVATSSSSRPSRRISIRATPGKALHCNSADPGSSAVTCSGDSPSAEALRGAATPPGHSVPAMRATATPLIKPRRGIPCMVSLRSTSHGERHADTA